MISENTKNYTSGSKKNNRTYDQEPDIQNVQKPVVQEEPETKNNRDQSIKAKVETE